MKQKIKATPGRKKFYQVTHLVYPVGTRSWSRYVQMCASYLTIQLTTLLGAFEIRFRTAVYEQLETRETLNLTLTLNLSLTLTLILTLTLNLTLTLTLKKIREEKFEKKNIKERKITNNLRAGNRTRSLQNRNSGN